MTQEVLKLALEGVEIHSPNSPEYIVCAALIEALRENAMREVQRLGQEIEQEPVAWLSTDSIGERHLCFDKPLDNDPVQPLYTTPPQPEPVAWGNFKEDGTLVGLSQHPEDQANWTNRKPLYTTPPQRTWVGLSDEEYIHITDSVYHQGHGLIAYYKAIEAKLKQKNGYAEEKNS